MTQDQSLLHFLSEQTSKIVRVDDKNTLLKATQVHSVRGAVKRSKAVLGIFEGSSPHKRTRKLCQHLDKIGGELGQIRKIDVAIRDARHLGMKSQRLKPMLKIRKKSILKMESVTGLIPILKKVRKRIKRSLEHDHEQSAFCLNRTLMEIVEELNQELKHPSDSYKSLHQLRILLKRPQYLLEALGKPMTRLDQLQNLLGDLHDAETLKRTLNRNGILIDLKEVKRTEKKIMELQLKMLRLKKPALESLIKRMTTSLVA